MNTLRLISFIKVQHIILYSFQILLLGNCINESMLYHTGQAEIPVHVISRKLLNLCHENIGSILDVLAPGAGRTV